MKPLLVAMAGRPPANDENPLARGGGVRLQNEAVVLSWVGVTIYFFPSGKDQQPIPPKAVADPVLCGIQLIPLANGFFPADSAALTPRPRAGESSYFLRDLESMQKYS